MANAIDAVFAERWSRRMQAKMQRVDIFREISSFEEEALLSKGDKVHRPYRSNLSVNTLGSEGSFTRQDVSDTDESLTVDQEKEVSFYIKDIDKIQSDYEIESKWADDAGVALANGIDGDVLAEVANALNTVDDADFGGTSGNGIVLTNSNVFDVFLAATEKLDRRNVSQDGRVAVLSPQFCRVLKSALINRETAWGDKVGENGYIGQYDGFNIYKSNGVYWTGVLSIVTQPTDGDTITLNVQNNEGTRSTITFTFKDTLGTTPNNVLIGTSDGAGQSADVAKTNLVALINAPGTTTTKGVALSAANQALMKGIAATTDLSADTVTVTAKGQGFVVVGETLTAAADTWTAATQLQHNYFGMRDAIDVVIQVKPNMKIKPRDGYVGEDVVSWQVYGIKTFAEGTRKMVDVKVRSNTFLAS